MPGSSDLSVKHLLTKCKSVTEWYTLGIHLDLTKSQLDDIYVTYHVHGVERQRTEMFMLWLRDYTANYRNGSICVLFFLAHHLVLHSDFTNCWAVLGSS